jgi:hypothetical protein
MKNKYKTEEGLEILIEELQGFPGIVNVVNNNFRDVYFSALGEEYKIRWYINLMTLTKDNIEIKFHNINTSNTWPSSNTTLQFEDENGNHIAILNTEIKDE